MPSENGGHTAEGFAVVYNQWTTIGGAFRERLDPGAFSGALGGDLLCLWNHDTARILGRVSAGTLRIENRREGLWFSVDLDPRTPDGQTAIGTVDRGDVNGCSFLMGIESEQWHDPGVGLPERTITKARIYEVTLTPCPAYEQTSVDLKRASNSAAASRRRAAAAMRLRGIA